MTLCMIWQRSQVFKISVNPSKFVELYSRMFRTKLPLRPDSGGKGMGGGFVGGSKFKSRWEQKFTYKKKKCLEQNCQPRLARLAH